MNRPIRIGVSVVLNPISSSPTTLMPTPNSTTLRAWPRSASGAISDLREERSDEADADDDADRCFVDAVLVAVVVDDREQHAVAGGEAGHQPAERNEDHRRRRWFASGGRRHVGR